MIKQKTGMNNILAPTQIIIMLFGWIWSGGSLTLPKLSKSAIALYSFVTTWATEYIVVDNVPFLSKSGNSVVIIMIPTVIQNTPLRKLTN